MLNIKYGRIFCDVISLFAQFFIISIDRACKEVSTRKYLKIFYGSVLWYDYLQKAMYRPCDLDLWHMEVNCFVWIDNDPISVLYQIQTDISTNSREIKYLNMGLCLLHVNFVHVKNDVKWRPIVTKFGTLIENMSRTGLYDCHIF